MSDLIDREKVIKIVHQTIYEFMDVDNDGQPITSEDRMLLSVNKAICNKIKDLPSEENMIEAIPSVEGRWLWDPGKMELICTHCGDGYHFDDADTVLSFISEAHFCMNCGARMVSGCKLETV